MYIGNNVITSYYKAAIVIVNDEKVKEGATVTNKRFTVYATPDENGMDYAANELLNYFAGYDEGYRPSTEQEFDGRRNQMLKALYYTWYGTDYAPILSRAYDELFVENGEPIDLEPYFHAYMHDKEVENISFKMTYYADDNGTVGEELDGAPSKAGTYHVRAEFIPADNQWTQEVVADGVTYKMPYSRGWTTYIIRTADPSKPGQQPGVDPSKPGQQPGIKDPSKTGGSVKQTNANNTSKAVKTGDTSMTTFYIVLLALSAMAAAAIVTRRRKKI